MLRWPVVAMMSAALYQEYELWLMCRGIRESFAAGNNPCAFEFLSEIEDGIYYVDAAEKSEAHRLYQEAKNSGDPYFKVRNAEENVVSFCDYKKARELAKKLELEAFLL